MVAMRPNQTDTDGDNRGRKRRRIALACEECRERKRKCDGQRPVCGACTKRKGQSCNWDDDRNTKGWSNNYVEGLRSRVRELEEALGSSQVQASNGNSSGELTAPNNTQPVQPHDAHRQSRCNPDTAVNNGFGLLGARNEHFPPAVLQSPADNQTPGSQDDTFDGTASESCMTEVDGMGVLSSSLQGGTRQRSFEYFGPSSTFSLLDEAHGAINQKLYSQKSRAMSNGQTHSQNALARDRASMPEYAPFGLFSVPPRAEADALVDSYCSWVHSLYPFVHLPSFHRRYLRLWDSTLTPRNSATDASTRRNNNYYDDMSDKLFHCLVNVVFALGALFSPRIIPQERHSVSKSFFDRCKKILDFDLLACGSPALVQTLLLMGQYLQSTDAPSTCWNIIGLAIRIAQGVGLHFEPKCCRGKSCPNGHDQLEREMRRRTWTGAVMFDRVLSLTYGRPLMVHPVKSKARFVLPLPIDDEFLSRDPENPGNQEPGSISLIECYVHAVKLQDILGQVLTSFYNRATDDNDDIGQNYQGSSDAASSTNRIDDSDLQVLLNVDELLSAWRENLPSHLKSEIYDSEVDQNSPSSPDSMRDRLLKRQARVLKARFLHVRLTLLRPVLFTLCDQGQGKAGSLQEKSIQTTMRHDMMVKAANLCVSAAQGLIDLIAGSIGHGSLMEKLPAPWYNVFYIHSSAIVLLLGYLCWPKNTTEITEDTFIKDYNRCITFFQAYQWYSPSASRCGKVLEVLQRRVFKHRNAPGLSNSQDSANGIIPHQETQSDSVNPDSTFLASNFPMAPPEVVTPSLFIDDINMDPMSQGWLDEQTVDMACLYTGPFLQNM